MFSEKLTVEMAGQAGAVRATEMIQWGAVFWLLAQSWGFRTLVSLLPEHASVSPAKQTAEVDAFAWRTVPHDCGVIR